MKALGLIETKGLVGAIEVADVACKTADVEILNKHIIKGGIVTIEIIGDVGAVKAATDASSEAAKKLGVFITSHVIPRPANEVYDILKKTNSSLKSEEKEEKKIETSEETVNKEISNKKNKK